MSYRLNYGNGATLCLELATNTILADCADPKSAELKDVAEAVSASIASPLDFPPLVSAVVPGDRVVIAMERGVPTSDALVQGIIQTLRDGPSELGSITVLLAEGEMGALPNGQSPQPDVAVRVHQACDRESLSYLAASTEGKPILLNKLLCDADLVLPVGVLRLDQSLDYFGVHSGLFPTFSDEAAQNRFRSPSTHDWTAQQRRRREEVAEAAWLLGIQMVVQVVPGPGDSLLEVIAGQAEAVTAVGQTLCQAAWQHPIPQRAELVIASIEGPAQSWEHFARALYSASQAVVDGGAIVLCTGITELPGPALSRLSNAASDADALQGIRRERSSDATAAAVLAEAKQRIRVYLLSELEQETVEDLGIGPVTEVADIERLARQMSSCVILGNAQQAVVAEGDVIPARNG